MCLTLHTEEARDEPFPPKGKKSSQTRAGLPTPGLLTTQFGQEAPWEGPAPSLMTLPRSGGPRPPRPRGARAEQAVRGCARPGRALTCFRPLGG